MKYAHLFFVFLFAVSCSNTALSDKSGASSSLAPSPSSALMSTYVSDGGSMGGASTTLMKASYAEEKSSSDTSMVGSNEEQFRIPEANIRTGTLTAGSFDDSAYSQVFRSFIDSVDKKLSSPLFEWGQQIIVHVHNHDRKPIGNAQIKIYNSSLQLVLNTTTASDGRANFLLGWDTEKNQEQTNSSNIGPREFDKFVVKITTENQVQNEQVFSLAQPQWNITVADTANLPQQLDIAFVIDATGSMDDEIRYIQVEAAGIASSVKKKFPQIDTRFALIVYRDKGDKYVIKDRNFSNIEDFMYFLSRQNADGGGDFPEAMDQALETANQNLSWRQKNTTRLLFLIADAPSHDHLLEATIRNINSLRKRGIKFYPIAASGVDEKAEYLMRIASFLTLGEYIFLTDDSGVGNTHAEPHIPFYYVQKLNVLITRMIASELTGQKFPPHHSQIIRVSGNPNFNEK